MTATNQQAGLACVEYQKRENGKLLTRFVANGENVAAIDKFLGEICQASEVHGNSRAVAVWGTVDEEKYDRRINNNGAKPITDRTFPSAKLASFHFGYRWNAVGQALNRARERGENVAVVGGVPVMWADEVPGID